MFIEHLVCARCWGESSEQMRESLCSHRIPDSGKQEALLPGLYVFLLPLMVNSCPWSHRTHEPGEQAGFNAAREHLFSVEPLLDWALSSTCSRASGFFPGQLSRHPPPFCLVFLPLSPMALSPGWPSHLGQSDSEGVCGRYWPLDILTVQVFLRQFQVESLAPLSSREALRAFPPSFHMELWSTEGWA